MPIAPALLWPTQVIIARTSLMDPQQDDEFREPIDTPEELIERAEKVQIEAQVHFGQFENQIMLGTGDDNSTSGYLVIDRATQKIYQLAKNDFIISIFDLDENEWAECLRLRITSATPKAQKGPFGLYKLPFKDDAKGT